MHQILIYNIAFYRRLLPKVETRRTINIIIRVPLLHAEKNSKKYLRPFLQTNFNALLSEFDIIFWGVFLLI